MKSSRAISRVRCMYEIDVAGTICLHHHENVNFVQIPDVADGVKRLNRI